MLRFLSFAVILKLANLRLFRIAESLILQFCDSCDSQNHNFCYSFESQIVRFFDSRESQNRKYLRFAIHVNRRITQFAILRFRKCNNCDSAILENLIIAIYGESAILIMKCWPICQSEIIGIFYLFPLPPLKMTSLFPLQ